MLTLSARGDYGLVLLRALAQLPAGQYATVRQVAAARHLPVRYLERVAGELVAAGIIASREGQGGGYALVRPAGRVRLTEVLEALEGSLEPVHCTHDGRCCERQVACERKTGWQRVHRRLYSVLSQHTLADLLAATT